MLNSFALASSMLPRIQYRITSDQQINSIFIVEYNKGDFYTIDTLLSEKHLKFKSKNFTVSPFLEDGENSLFKIVIHQGKSKDITIVHRFTQPQTAYKISIQNGQAELRTTRYFYIKGTLITCIIILFVNLLIKIGLVSIVLHPIENRNNRLKYLSIANFVYVVLFGLGQLLLTQSNFLMGLLLLPLVLAIIEMIEIVSSTKVWFKQIILVLVFILFAILQCPLWAIGRLIII
jgi:hypothetical protein